MALTTQQEDTMAHVHTFTDANHVQRVTAWPSDCDSCSRRRVLNSAQSTTLRDKLNRAIDETEIRWPAADPSSLQWELGDILADTVNDYNCHDTWLQAARRFLAVRDERRSIAELDAVAVPPFHP